MFDFVPTGDQPRIISRDHHLAGARPDSNRADLDAKATPTTEIRCPRIGRNAAARFKPNPSTATTNSDESRMRQKSALDSSFTR